MTATRAILTRDVATVPDVLADPDFPFQAVALAAGFRSVLAVPLMRDEIAIGAISVGRPEPGRFPDQQIALLQTFADQAVIAIENVRLFKGAGIAHQRVDTLSGRTEGAGRSRSSGQLDLGPRDRAPHHRIPAATSLPAWKNAPTSTDTTMTIGEFLPRGGRHADDLVEVLRSRRIRKGEGAVGRLAVVLEPVQVRDILDRASYQSGVRRCPIRSRASLAAASTAPCETTPLLSGPGQ